VVKSKIRNHSRARTDEIPIKFFSMRTAITCTLVLASLQLGAAFVPSLGPIQIAGRTFQDRACVSRAMRTRLPLLALKASEAGSTALSEFSGVDASGNQVKLRFIVK
jgi:hypothetical protein